MSTLKPSQLTEQPFLFQAVALNKFKAVIFDVDGTLYNLKKLYDRMHLELFRYYLVHPCQIVDIWILYSFIHARERNIIEAVSDLEESQYEWAKMMSKMPLDRVRRVIQKWVFEVPLNHINDCCYPEVIELFGTLTEQGIKTAVFSDYPSQAKLSCLGLSPHCIISATDKNVNRLKPDPKGLYVAAETLGVLVNDCLFIGDRDDRDGECARRAGMPYLILGSDRNILSSSAKQFLG